jgi:Bacterial Ig-like domain (group 3)
MSEKIYALLLRLYPAHFRNAYGNEALQLFRDRARSERGFLSGLRLWLDLLGDLAISVPREYRSTPRTIAASSAQHCSNGTPSFHILQDETLSFGSLLYGGIVSLVVYSSILFVLSHGRSHFPNSYWALEHIPRYSVTAAKETPTVSLSYSTPHSSTRSTVTLTAIVSAAGTGPIPTGNVIFFDGHTVLNTVTLQDGTITVNPKVSHTTPHAFKAIYCGDANYSSASSIGER